MFFKDVETCIDGIKNQGETGVDCGGPCFKCGIKIRYLLKYQIYFILALISPHIYGPLYNLRMYSKWRSRKWSKPRKLWPRTALPIWWHLQGYVLIMIMGNYCLILYVVCYSILIIRTFSRYNCDNWANDNRDYDYRADDLWTAIGKIIGIWWKLRL